MKKYKKLPGLILALMLLCMSLTVSAFAAETPAFSDVAADSPWVEGINYAAELGITSGTGNGCFSYQNHTYVRGIYTLIFFVGDNLWKNSTCCSE